VAGVDDGWAHGADGEGDGERDEHVVAPAAPPPAPRPRSAGSVALGRAMMGLGEIIEGKPPQDAYEYVLEVDDTDEPFDPRTFTVVIPPIDPSS
jgi:hypothetical protein